MLLASLPIKSIINGMQPRVFKLLERGPLIRYGYLVSYMGESNKSFEHSSILDLAITWYCAYGIAQDDCLIYKIVKNCSILIMLLVRTKLGTEMYRIWK